MYESASASEQAEILERFLQRTIERFPDEVDDSGEPSSWLVQLYAIHRQAVSGKSSVETAIQGTEKLLYLEGDEGVLPEALSALDQV